MITDIQKRINASTGVFRGTGTNLNNKSFTKQLDTIILDTKEKMLAMMRQSLQETVEMMQIPLSRGGRMRIDTGFLRSSGAANLGGLPIGPSENPEKLPHVWNGGNLELTLANMQIGDSFYWGWTARYAKYRETYDGFMEAALQNWQKTVDSVITRIKSRLSK